MLVAGGLCRCELQRDGASCGAGKVHRLLRVPPTGCCNALHWGRHQAADTFHDREHGGADVRGGGIR